ILLSHKGPELYLTVEHCAECCGRCLQNSVSWTRRGPSGPSLSELPLGTPHQPSNALSRRTPMNLPNPVRVSIVALSLMSIPALAQNAAPAATPAPTPTVTPAPMPEPTATPAPTPPVTATPAVTVTATPAATTPADTSASPE